MFLAQLALSIAVWGATIFALVRSRGRLQNWAEGISRGKRALSAIGLLTLSIVILGLGMLALANGGLTPTGLTFWGWPFITVVGALFVVLQTAGLLPLVLNAASLPPTGERVTRTDRDSSDTMDANRP